MKFNDPKNEPCADLLDSQPMVISGYALTEFVFSIVINLVIWPLATSLVLGFFIDIVICIMIGIVISLAVIMRLGKWLEKNKEGKPNGYFSLKIYALINNVFPLGFVLKDTQWEITRDR